MKHTTPIVAKLEALLLVMVGLGIGVFAISQNYGLLMNPKFRWLTLGGAVAVFCMGATGFFGGNRKGLTGPVAFLVLFGIVLAGKPYVEGAGSSGLIVPQLYDESAVEDPDFPLMDMKALITAAEEDPMAAKMAFSTLGVIKHLPASGEKKEVAVMRSYMVCCAADAIALGFRLVCPETETLTDGDWVVVSGTLVPLPEPAPEQSFRTGAASFSVVNRTHVIQSVKIASYSTLLPTLAQQLSSENLSMFAQALKTTELWQVLEGEGPFTVFAPINTGFKIADRDNTGDPGSHDKSGLKNRLSIHIVSGRYLERDLFDTKTLSTIDGQKLDVHMDNGTLRIGTSRILFSDMEARNGVVHIIYPEIAAKDK